MNGWVGAEATVPDLDFQVGGGYVNGVTANYKGARPISVVSLNTPQTPELVTPYGSVSGLTVNVSETTLPSVVRVFNRNAQQRIFARVSDINVNGPLDSVILTSPQSGSIGNVILASDVVAAPSKSFLETANSTYVYEIDLKMSRCINASDLTVPALSLRNSGNHKVNVSAEGCSGWTRYRRITRTEQGHAIRVEAIAPANAENSPQLSFSAATLAVGEVFKIPESAYNVQSRTIFISVGGGDKDQAIFAVSSSGITAIGGASTWVSAIGSQPTTGAYRIWVEGTDTYVSNNSALTRTFGFMQW